MTRASTQTSLAQASRPAALRLGERLRQLRVAAGLTQSELAGERFSKEYVSQIERGKTRPTGDTIAWLAGQLDVDAGYLANGVSTDERGRVEATLTRAEALVEAHRYEESVAEFEQVRPAVAATGAAELEARVLSGEAWARMQQGELREALDLLMRARTVVEGEPFSDLDRSEIFYRLGVCRYKLSSISTAIGLFNEAYGLAEQSQLPCDLLRSNILAYRSRCYRRQRDLEAAREDVERALELAQSLDDSPTMANVYVQASLVAERMGHWVLARSYAERAKSYYEELNDQRNLAGLLNNLGGLNLMLGKPEEAIEYLKSSYSTALDADSMEEAAQATGSLAAVHLELNDFEQAERFARQALDLLEGRVDFLHEIGPSQLVLGRALMEQGRLDDAEEALRAADSSFEQLSSVSHRARSWIALGDLAARRSDDRAAARLYRNAAEALQDVRF
ncbi:MAG: helix-turn-helix transcriptional regulator [Actinobacteria bacterium]|nr:MAG: helix-turn-helix transcriptional regulator [Actinomycetota bacterium]